MINVTNQPSNRNLNFVLDEIFNSFPATWGKDVKENTPSVPANVFETNEEYHVELLAAGRTKDEFKVKVENQVLTVTYEKKAENGTQDLKTIRKEFGIKNFKRSFQLDEKINAEAIEAKYENGILKLVLPKKEELKVIPKEITIL